MASAVFAAVTLTVAAFSPRPMPLTHATPSRSAVRNSPNCAMVADLPGDYHWEYGNFSYAPAGKGYYFHGIPG